MWCYTVIIQPGEVNANVKLGIRLGGSGTVNSTHRKKAFGINLPLLFSPCAFSELPFSKNNFGVTNMKTEVSQTLIRLFTA